MNKSGISIPPRHGRGGGRKGRKTVGKRRPAGKRRSALPLILAAAAVLAIALIAIFLPRYLRKKPEDALDAVFFDVGQGDAILLSFPEGEFALIDAGSRDDAELLVEELACRGVRRLSFAAVTHPHEDHAGGMEAVLRAIPADKVYLSDGENDAGYYIDLLEWLEKSGTPCGVPGNGEVVYEKAGCRVTAVYNGEGAENLNDSSLIFRAVYGETSLLLTGDAEIPEETRLLALGGEIASDLLKLGHHGSQSSTGEAFLDAVKPRYAVISCGRNNDYGHPHREVLDRLERRGISLSRTDREGTVLFRSDGRAWTKP